MNTLGTIERILNSTWFTKDDGKDGGIIPYTFNPGVADTKLLVVTGANAAGKSFFRRYVGAHCSQQKWEHIALSMEKRTGADYTDPCMRALMFGSERDRATGGISGHIVIMGVKTAGERTAPNVLFFDEPDLGLSDEYAMDAGHRIGSFCLTESHTQLVCVVTHRRILLETLLGIVPTLHHLHVGTETPACLSEWIRRPIQRQDLEQLKSRQHALFLKISQRLDGRAKGSV